MKKLRKLKTKNKFFKIETKKEKFKWKMEKDLAEYANSMAKSYITDKDLEEGILLKTQVPSNIDKTPVVDNFMSKLLANNR